MFLLTAIAASAAPLDLMFVTPDANGTFDVSWGLSETGWATVRGLVQLGNAPPALVITVDPEGRNLTRSVPLNNSVGKEDFGGSNWPTNVRVTLHVVDGSGALDALTLRGAGGPTVNVYALGGSAPQPAPSVSPRPTPRPAPSSSSSTSTQTRSSDGTTTTTRTTSGGGTTTTTTRASVDIGQIDPNAALNTVMQVAATAQAMADAQAARDASTSVASNPDVPVPQGPTAKQVALDPNDPRTRACTPLVPSGDVPRCIHDVHARPMGVAEAEQCARLSTLGLREECWGFVRAATVSIDGMLGACVDVFGPDVWAMRCIKTVVVAETPPVDDIRACGELFADPEDRMQCMRRFQALTWSPREVVPACQQSFGTDAIACMHAVSGGVGQPIPALIPACADAFGELELRTTCLELHRRNTRGDPAGAVGACAGLFEREKDRMACVDRVRQDPSPARIQACASEPEGKKRMKCAEGP